MQALIVALAQLAYLLMFLGLASRNIELLRGFFLAGSLCAVAYSLISSHEPLWVPLSWHAAFVAMNGAHVVITKLRRQRQQLDALERFLRRTVFPQFPVEELKSLVRMGMEGGIGAGETLLEAGGSAREFACVLSGSVRVIDNGVKICDVPSGRIIGIPGFIEDGGNGCDVIANSDVKVMVWTKAAIEQWIGNSVPRLSLIQAAVGAQLIEQLQVEQEARRKLAQQAGGMAA